MSENFFDFMIWLSFTSTSLLISLWIEYRKLKRELCKKIDRYEEKIDEYTRIVGFARPISSYSKERAEEYHQRKWFSSDNIVE